MLEIGDGAVVVAFVSVQMAARNVELPSLGLAGNLIADQRDCRIDITLLKVNLDQVVDGE